MALAGERLGAGDVVLALVGSANHDPERFADPDRLWLARPDAGGHLGFGGGIHYCLGAALARAEAQVAVGALVARFGALEQAGDEQWSDRITLRGLAALPVRCT